MTTYGTWFERLEALAVGPTRFAVGGWRDVPAGQRAQAYIHVAPLSLLDGRGPLRALEVDAACRALAFIDDELLLSGDDAGRVIAWEVGTGKRIATLELGAPVRALAIDANVARGASGTVAVATADGAVTVRLEIGRGTAKLTIAGRRAVGSLTAIAIDPASLLVAGGADGTLWISALDGTGEPRTVSPGGDGGIRALACLGDGRVAIGCGDGSLRLCYVVGEVEPRDRSRDDGHAGALRGLALAPLAFDDAGRELPRRLFSAGEDGAIKSWELDSGKRPSTDEPDAGPLTAIVLVPGAVAGVDKALGRLWVASATRKVVAQSLDSDGDSTGDAVTIESALDRYGEELGDDDTAAKVKRAAIEVLEAAPEEEARTLLDEAIGDESSEVAIFALEAVARSHRRSSRSTVRDALESDEEEVRAAAFAALLELEHDQPIAALRPALESTEEDVRLLAIDALAEVAPTSVIAAGLLAGALQDDEAAVRNRAFDKLRELGSDPLAAARIALSRGTPDLRVRALLEIGFVARASDEHARGVTAGALDDPDAKVRSAAFLAAVMQRPRLAAALHERLDNVARALDRVASDLEVELDLPSNDGEPLEDDELEPLFAALACRSADIALRGASSLLAVGDPRSVGAVLQLTREDNAGIRRGATASLVAAIARWPGDDRLSARLAWLLDDSDETVRSFAFDALAKTAAKAGDGELELAELALRCSQEDVRVRALQILVRVGAPGSSLHERADLLLGDALDDEAAPVRGEAFRTLWAWHASEPQSPLARGAASRHGDVRGQVVAELERRQLAKQSSPEMDRLLVALVADPVEEVGLAALAALTKPREPAAASVYVTALRSRVPAVRAAGAAAVAAKRVTAPEVRGAIVKLIADDHPDVHIAAIEALDAIAPTDAEGFALAFSSLSWEVRVRAAELCAQRRDARALAPMEKLLAVGTTQPDRPADELRQRAARAIANVGDRRALATVRALIDDEDPAVREMGARGVALAARPGDEAMLVALLGHPDLPVRSWAGEGLARLGDPRALPVLAGTQRHDHRPLRIGAIVGFVALGPDGVRGLRQALEDPDREIQDLAFAVIVARDVALAKAGLAPDLLVDAMTSPSAEIRFAAARLVERRADGDALDADAIGELVGPCRPEKLADEKDWPSGERRAAILQVLADAIASAEPGLRYSAAQVLAARTTPLVFWREAAALAGPGTGTPAPYAPTPTGETTTTRRSGWLRRLVGTRAASSEASSAHDVDRAKGLVFGVYSGLVRQAPARGAADETHRVRRDAIGRLVELARAEAVGLEAVLPVLAHAIGDPHRLVRQAAFAAVRTLYPPGALAPLALAISAASDLGREAIDELVPLALAGDRDAAALLGGALDADRAEVRAYAALRVAKLYPAGSVEPQLAAARSRHGDVRLAAITELATSSDRSSAIDDALIAALASEHADLRLVAAVALARRGNATGIEVLSSFLSDDDHAADALEALLAQATDEAGAAGAAEAIAARLDDDPDHAEDLDEVISALGRLRHVVAAPSLVRVIVANAVDREDEFESTADDAVDALLEVLLDRTKQPRRSATVAHANAIASRSRSPTSPTPRRRRTPTCACA